MSGDRYLNVLQCRLNSDLYRANLIPNALCSCGKSDETAKHFLFHCENFIVQRNMFLTGIREFNNDLAIYELTLSFGNEILNDEKKYTYFLACSQILSKHRSFHDKVTTV